jgi:hypothetical protein
MRGTRYILHLYRCGIMILHPRVSILRQSRWLPTSDSDNCYHRTIVQICGFSGKMIYMTSSKRSGRDSGGSGSGGGAIVAATPVVSL